MTSNKEFFLPKETKGYFFTKRTSGVGNWVIDQVNGERVDVEFYSTRTRSYEERDYFAKLSLRLEAARELGEVLLEYADKALAKETT